MQQLPIRVRESLVPVDYTDMNAISGALSQLDMANTEREGVRRNIAGQSNNVGNSYYSNAKGNQQSQVNTHPSNAYPRRPGQGSPAAYASPLGRPNSSVLEVGVESAPGESQSASLFPAGNHASPINMSYLSMPPPPIPDLSGTTEAEYDLN